MLLYTLLFERIAVIEVVVVGVCIVCVSVVVCWFLVLDGRSFILGKELCELLWILTLDAYEVLLCVGSYLGCITSLHMISNRLDILASVPKFQR